MWSFLAYQTQTHLEWLSAGTCEVSASLWRGTLGISGRHRAQGGRERWGPMRKAGRKGTWSHGKFWTCCFGCLEGTFGYMWNIHSVPWVQMDWVCLSHGQIVSHFYSFTTEVWWNSWWVVAWCLLTKDMFSFFCVNSVTDSNVFCPNVRMLPRSIPSYFVSRHFSRAISL